MAFGEEALEHFVEHQAPGAVVARTLFVLDDPALIIEITLRDRAEQMPHAVAFHEQHPVNRPARDGLEIIGSIP